MFGVQDDDDNGHGRANQRKTLLQKLLQKGRTTQHATPPRATAFAHVCFVVRGQIFKKEGKYSSFDKGSSDAKTAEQINTLSADAATASTPSPTAASSSSPSPK
jgi:hypothetical protein